MCAPSTTAAYIKVKLWIWISSDEKCVALDTQATWHGVHGIYWYTSNMAWSPWDLLIHKQHGMKSMGPTWYISNMAWTPWDPTWYTSNMARSPWDPTRYTSNMAWSPWDLLDIQVTWHGVHGIYLIHKQHGMKSMGPTSIWKDLVAFTKSTWAPHNISEIG